MILLRDCKIRTNIFDNYSAFKFIFHKIHLTNKRWPDIMIDKMANRTEQMEWNIGENDENACIQAAQRGDSEALEHLLREYGRLIRAEAHMFTLRGADLEDMIQEGMLALLTAIEHFDSARGVSFSWYARLCVERRLRPFIRGQTAKKHQPLSHAISLDKPLFEDLETYPQTARQTDPEALVIGREEHRETLERLFDLLSRFERQVLQLYLYGLSYDEIAKKIGKTRKSVINAMQRVHQKAERL